MAEKVIPKKLVKKSNMLPLANMKYPCSSISPQVHMGETKATAIATPASTVEYSLR